MSSDQPTGDDCTLLDPTNTSIEDGSADVVEWGVIRNPETCRFSIQNEGNETLPLDVSAPIVIEDTGNDDGLDRDDAAFFEISLQPFSPLNPGGTTVFDLTYLGGLFAPPALDNRFKLRLRVRVEGQDDFTFVITGFACA